MSINGHKTSCTRTMYLKKKEKKRYIASWLHPSIITTLPLTKMSNSPPKNDYSRIQNYSPFLSRIIKGKSVKQTSHRQSQHLHHHHPKHHRHHYHYQPHPQNQKPQEEVVKGQPQEQIDLGRLPFSYAANMDIHLIQLYGKCIEASIHVRKLRHDVSQRHIARRRRRSGCGSSRMRWSRTGGSVESCCHDLNCTSLHFTVAASMAHMKVKGLDAGEGTKKWRKILVIAEVKMSLSRDAES